MKTLSLISNHNDGKINARTTLCLCSHLFQYLPVFCSLPKTASKWVEVKKTLCEFSSVEVNSLCLKKRKVKLNESLGIGWERLGNVQRIIFFQIQSKYSEFNDHLTDDISYPTLKVMIPAITLKLLSAVFYQVFISHQMIAFKNYEKCFLFYLKSSFCSRVIQILYLPVSHCFRG